MGARGVRAVRRAGRVARVPHDGRRRRRAIDEFYDGSGIPLRRSRRRIAPPSFRKKFSCYTCSRNRKRILFDEAERVGAGKIALGHHMDDIARTTLMNMLFHGELATMMPVQKFFGGP